MDNQNDEYIKFLSVYSKNVIASKTDLRGSITYVSDAFCVISGYSREEMIGKSHNIVRHPDMPSTLFKELWETIPKGETFRGEIKNRKKDGSSYWVDVVISPDFDINEKIVGYSAIRQDITEKKKYEKLNKEHEKLLTKFSKYVIASKTDLNGTITYVSDAFCEISGYDRSELIGEKHNIVRHPDMPKEMFEKLWKTIKSGEVFFGEIKNKTKDGGFYWVEVAVSPDFDDDGNAIGYSAVRHNISQRKLVEQLMVTDHLTKAKNRQYYDTCIKEEISRVKRYGTHMSLIILDIDKFKKINDVYGHSVGDSVLIELSNLIQDSIRESDTFCRIGGEEFVIISPNSSLENNFLFAEKIREIICSHEFEFVKNVTISLGLSQCLKDDDENNIFKRADSALYESKMNGRNRVSIK